MYVGSLGLFHLCAYWSYRFLASLFLIFVLCDCTEVSCAYMPILAQPFLSNSVMPYELE